MRTIIVVCLFAVASTTLVIAAGNNWRTAQNKVNLFEKDYEDLRRMTPRETQRIVDAICRADDVERKDIARSAGERAKNRVTAEYSKLEERKDDALTALDDVLADSSLSSHHDDASELRAKVTRHWGRIGKMTRSVRGANHPVIAFMLEQGNKAHRDYQKTAGNCDISEFPVKSGRVDCIKINKSTCTVIELKPDNMSAINQGSRKAYQYARDLRGKSRDFKNLVAKDGKFAACKKFTERVDCYTLCPKIDEHGAFERTDATWRTGCR